jgi:hypothetical protein
VTVGLFEQIWLARSDTGSDLVRRMVWDNWFIMCPWEKLVVLDYGKERLYTMRAEAAKALAAGQSRVGVFTTDIMRRRCLLLYAPESLVGRECLSVKSAL